MQTTKFIREGRFGPPKSYKTGAVVSTYPKPLLVLNFDEGGLDVIKEPVYCPDNNMFRTHCKTGISEPITAVNFRYIGLRMMDLSYQPTGNSKALDEFVEKVNALVTIGCPWKTVVLDPISGLTDATIGHIAAARAAALEDARKWASMVGNKIKQTIDVLQSLQCHTVMIMHSYEDKNELTGEIRTYPQIPSSLRERIGAMFSQFFYQTVEAGSPRLYTKSVGFVKGIGARWPADLPASVKPDYDSIYGTAVHGKVISAT